MQWVFWPAPRLLKRISVCRPLRTCSSLASYVHTERPCRNAEITSRWAALVSSFPLRSLKPKDFNIPKIDASMSSCKSQFKELSFISLILIRILTLIGHTIGCLSHGDSLVGREGLTDMSRLSFRLTSWAIFCRICALSELSCPIFRHAASSFVLCMYCRSGITDMSCLSFRLISWASFRRVCAPAELSRSIFRHPASSFVLCMYWRSGLSRVAANLSLFNSLLRFQGFKYALDAFHSNTTSIQFTNNESINF